ncbi:MAG: hypothetical protein ACKVRN_08000 [Pyrinomonadaceae bacterium]
MAVSELNAEQSFGYFCCDGIMIYGKVTLMETMTLTINLPKDVGVALENKAKLSKRKATEFVEDLVTKEVNRPSFDEILAPIREGFKKSGMTEDELDALIESERQAIWDEKHGMPTS